MKLFVFVYCFLGGYVLAQDELPIKPIDSMLLQAHTIHGMDSFGALYFTAKNNSFTKKTDDTILTYSNFQLGEISSANAFNPLKINVFYKDFNTVILLDNRLAEISKLDFDQIQPFRNISHVSTGYDSTLWLFNQDTQQLELFDYLLSKTKLKTIPVQSQVLDLKSDYNYCYMLTERFLYVYSYFGSLITKIKNDGYTEIGFSKDFLVLKRDQELVLFKEDYTNYKTINLPNLLIKQFFLTDETLYIYDDEKLRRYQLKTH